MFKRWLTKLKLNDGFSLVEALITIAIVGIAMIPVSMVFTQTINTTVSTRKQLVANELSQEYIEAIKSKNFTDFATVFNGAKSRTILDTDTQTTFDLMGLEPLPKGYKAIITYDDSATIDLPTFALSTPNAMPVVNAIVTIPSGFLTKVDIQDVASTTILNYPVPATSSTHRVIKIVADRDTNTMSIRYGDSLTTNNIIDARYNLNISSIPSPAIRFIMGNNPSTGTAITTRIDVESNLASEIKIYIYEDATNSVKATTKVISGSVSVSRNLNIVDASKKRIVGLKVEIYDSISNKLLSTFNTTKVDE
jgi:prepilin-type N-terminal cleavage/methylation domain-containing protein